ncbi:efflux RND transporter periplasmic adaptor subunit [Martelella alba]|uniref:Efflux RND transporter periplasmic adaptor subunit n=1 Tax=Martelella alba TaxID=2590451 RepID=A0ABY2SKB7_9HYPH|nr:efflux RND transporter periplasmic adaptor subunit [Martelella alba]TKI05981.1 efflux RND transporter periplasmic adaptor subunit [Martelella alba]
MRIKVISLVIASLMLTACDNSAKLSGAGNPPPQVDVVTLKTEPVTLSTTLPGRTTSVRTAEVRPQVDGIILKRLFKEGSEVKAGQQLYQIDPATYQAAYDKAKATLLSANALAKRYTSLVAAHAVSEQQYDDAISSAAEAKADLETAQINLDYTKVKAPISGRIDRSLVTEGALVTNGQSTYLTTITQLDPMYVDISESSRNLLRLRQLIAQGKLKAINNHQAAVRLILEDGSTYPVEGRLEFSEVRVDENTGSVTLRATFPNPERILLPGMFVHAVLAQGVQEQGIMVPQESVGHDTKGRPYVYVVNADNKVAQRYVHTGEMINNSWLVTDGLNVGDRVVTAGIQRIAPGITVTPLERASASTEKSHLALSMTDPSAQ